MMITKQRQPMLITAAFVADILPAKFLVLSLGKLF